MNLLRLVRPLGLLALVAGLHAATTPAGRTDDLGKNLAYLRPSIAAKADGPALLKTLPGKSAVLDLRYFSSDENADAWLAAIKALAAPKRLCIVLVSPETSPSLLAGLARGIPGCITVGRASPALAANILVDTPAETDRKAWEAIGQGKELAPLMTENADKPRYDEAVLAKEYAADINGNSAGANDDTATPSPKTKARESKDPAPPAPLIDAVLARAVQIQRGLLALKKI